MMMTKFVIVPKNPVALDTDHLTGLPKRLDLEQELKDIAKSGEHALCLIDIDSFIVVNDVYGHVAGDELLVAITKVIRKNIDSKDTLARIGNDEYGLILKDVNLHRALTIANNIRESVKQLKMQVGPSVYSVTVSIGATMLNKQNNDSSTNLKNVEVACRAAKQTRDKVQVVCTRDFSINCQRGHE